jgi:hypothetical protein
MLCLGALLCAGLVPASADGATLVNKDGTLAYTGEPGEQNVVEIGTVYGSVQVGPMRGTVTGCLQLNATIFGCSNVRALEAQLGDGDDTVYAGGPFQANLYGGPGDDTLISMTATSGGLAAGGPGIDTASLGSRDGLPISITLDNVANDGLAGAGINVLSDVENVSASSVLWPEDAKTAERYGAITLTGSGGPNELVASEGNDTLTGGAGSDVLFGKGGNDTLHARDGETDRVECGSGTDTALVDAVDHVSDTCEQVQVAVAAAPVPSEDTAPRVGFKAGSALEVEVGDDRGVASVRFLSGDKLLCTVTAAPYVCAPVFGVADVGRATIVAVVTDSAGQTATAVRTMTVPRIKPRSVSLTVKRQGRRFLATGKVALPADVPCSGEVAVTTGKTTRTGKLSRSCTFRVVLPKSGRFVATYRGTAAIEAKRSATRTAR